MGPGYVIAALLEVAGLSGLVVAAFVMHTERKARVAELRTVLRSGPSSVAAIGAALQGRWWVIAPRVVHVPVVTHRREAGERGESAARSELSRAIAPPARAVAASVSAG